jgi:hypothetical protein
MKFKKYPIIGEVPGWDLNLYTNAEQKVGKLSSSALLDFADAAGSGMARGYMDYRSQARVESLLEIRHALMTLWALNEQLIQRSEAVARLDSSS